MVEDKLKVLAVGPPEGSGGISRYTKKLFSKIKEIDNVEVNYQYTAPKSILSWLKIYKKCLLKNVDVLHFQFGTKNLGLLAPILLPLIRISTQTKVILTAHEKFDAKKTYLDQLNLDKISKGSLETSLFIYDWIIYHSVHKTLVHTEEHQKELEKEFGKDSKVIPHFIPEPKPVTAESLGSLQREYIEELREKNVITTFGRITPKKGHRNIIEVLGETEDTVYLIAGPELENHKDYISDLKAEVKNRKIENQVFFSGFLQKEEIPFLFQITDIAAFPYENVTQSGALSQAITYDIPILTSNIDHFNKIVSEERIGETLGTSEEIEEMLENTEKYQSNIKKFKQDKSLSKISRNHVNLYRGELK
jgi:glycosyltransferase involved in cell wall biosynthesis